MFIYILNIVLILFWYFILSYKKSAKKEVWFLLLTGLQLILLGGLRGLSVGTDTNAYAYEYEFFKMYGIARYSGLEYGYVGIMSVLSYFNANFIWLKMIVAFIIVFCVFKAIYDLSANVFLSVYLFISMYFYYYSFNGIRQCIAVAICFFGYKHLLNRKLLKYILCILVAAQFHTTAYIMLPVYFIYTLTKQRKRLFVFLIMLYFMVVFINPFMMFVLRFLPRYIAYLDSVYMETFAGARYIIVYGALVCFGAVILRVTSYKFKVTSPPPTPPINVGGNDGVINEGGFPHTFMGGGGGGLPVSDKKFILEYLFICIAFVLNLLTIYGFTLFTRLAWYFTIYSIIFIPSCLSKIKNKYTRMIIFWLIIFITFMYHYYFLSVNYHRIVPWELVINN
ncbi:MAG: EpsG family protein [Candidatus Cloacimonetes bacterium]|nr:EpsG family protein [Candidatus Cloacimonadota bacterium]